MRKYKAKNGATQFMPSIEEAQEMAECQEGFCVACGNTQGNCEPDARKYVCDSCRMPKVYGAEELVVMGLVY